MSKGIAQLVRAVAAFSVALAFCSSTFAQEPLSILGYTDSASFWLEIPAGWRSDAEAAKRTGAMFVLLPQQSTFDTAPAVIVASAYHATSLDVEMTKDRASFLGDDPKIRISDRQAIVAKSGARFSVREFRSLLLREQGFESVAYHQQGPDVVILTLSAQTEPTYREGQKTFAVFLKTYEASSLKVKNVQ
jgi:hypothetical protein